MSPCVLPLPQALCTEASLHALRRSYPQIYDADEKLLIDPRRVAVERRDFMAALNAITPASHRSAAAHARCAILAPLEFHTLHMFCFMFYTYIAARVEGLQIFWRLCDFQLQSAKHCRQRYCRLAIRRPFFRTGGHISSHPCTTRGWRLLQ